MIVDRFLSRDVWEAKFRSIGAERIQDGVPHLNTAEWWCTAEGAPFTVPVEDDGSCEFWAVQRILSDQTGKPLFTPPEEPPPGPEAEA